MRAYGIAVAEARLVTSASDIAGAVAALGDPLVMKIVSPDIVHKSDVGGVRVGLSGESAVREAFDAMLARVRAHQPSARVTGVLLQRQVDGGREMIAGMSRDPGFGPLVMFGLGGIFVEAVRDVTFRLAPIDDRQAREMVRGIAGAKILEGIRGQPPADRDALADVLRRIAQLAVDIPAIAELDANPVLALERGAIVVDARVALTTGESQPESG